MPELMVRLNGLPMYRPLESCKNFVENSEYRLHENPFDDETWVRLSIGECRFYSKPNLNRTQEEMLNLAGIKDG